MKIRRTGLAVVAALASVSTPALTAVAESATVVESATGSGHVTFEGAFRTFAFTARKYDDGTTKGQMQLKNRAFGVIVHAEIDCLTVFGNTAVMSGVVKHSNAPELEGAPVLFAVEDNGEGAKAPPDRITEVFPGPPPAIPDLCELVGPPPEFLLIPVEKGNIQVH